jgi:hypothetical protein
MPNSIFLEVKSDAPDGRRGVDFSPHPTWLWASQKPGASAVQLAVGRFSESSLCRLFNLR